MRQRLVSRRPIVTARVATRSRPVSWADLPFVLVPTVVGASIDHLIAGVLGGMTFIILRRTTFA